MTLLLLLDTLLIVLWLTATSLFELKRVEEHRKIDRFAWRLVRYKLRFFFFQFMCKIPKSNCLCFRGNVGDACRWLCNFDYNFSGKIEVKAEFTTPPLFFFILAADCLVIMVGLR